MSIKTSVVFQTDNNNFYLYNIKKRKLHHISPFLATIVSKRNQCDSYEFKKWKTIKFRQKLGLEESKNDFRIYDYLDNNGYFSTIDNLFIETDVTPDDIFYSLVNLPSICFEVTDNCNLNCYYCGYGKFYDGYEERKGKNIKFSIIKAFMDYYSNFLTSLPQNYYVNKPLHFSFYGGEPLLNFDIIKETVEYIKKLKFPNRLIKYTITTNGILLDKYIDFLKGNNFNILISIDGNEYNNSFRVDKSGKNSFTKLYYNIKYVQKKYPEYYIRNVNFNCVLHQRNSFKEVIAFVQSEFNKTIQITELNCDNVDLKMKDEFNSIYKNSFDDYNSYLTCCTKDSIPLANNMHLRDIKKMSSILSPYNFRTIIDFFYNSQDKRFPTGSCLPFNRSVLINVNNKILFCERVPHNRTVGYIDENNIVQIDLKKLAECQNESYSKIIPLCNNCYASYFCSKCLFSKSSIEGCEYFLTEKNFSNYLSFLVNHIELNPNDYAQKIKEITVI